MKIKRSVVAGIACVLASSAWAQTAPPKPLTLTLPSESRPIADPAPAHDVSVESAPVAKATAAAATVATASASSGSPALQPGVYYGDTSARPVRADRADARGCDDSIYNQPQVHGSVGVGVVAGNHISGNYQTGTIDWSKALGSCEHPTGGIDISIRVGNGNFNGGRYRRH
ncbi:MAG: hypothetical protein WBV61_10410 [Rhodanobacteraceae bacterium]